MANGHENLRPFDTLTEERQREIRSAGGKASQKKKREQKQLKELLEIFLSMDNLDTGTDNYMAITAALGNQALQGNVKAYEVIRDTIGQKPVEQQQVDMSATITVDYGDD